METKRLLSLDAFRGFTVAAMILVNFPGTWSQIYAPLRHAIWNGLTPTDLIFPFFLFIVGVAIAFAFTKLKDAGKPSKKVYARVVLRALKIYGVGLILNLIPDFDFINLRYTGVLQRISIVFLVCGFLFLFTRWKTQALLGVIMLLVYWLAMTLIPTPGYSEAKLEPGCNLAAWIDSQYMPGKLWNDTWDPEGLLSTLPAMVTTISGMLTGTFLLSKKSWEQKVVYLMVTGFLLAVLGWIWNWTFPINKNLWTSSYVVFTSGLALMTFGSLIFAVDILGYKKWIQTGVAFGSNAIAIYVLANLLGILFYDMNIGGNSLNMHFMDFLTNQIGTSPKFASFLYAFLFVGVNYIPAWVLYKRKIFIKL